MRSSSKKRVSLVRAGRDLLIHPHIFFEGWGGWFWFLLTFEFILADVNEARRLDDVRSEVIHHDY